MAFSGRSPRLPRHVWNVNTPVSVRFQAQQFTSFQIVIGTQVFLRHALANFDMDLVFLNAGLNGVSFFNYDITVSTRFL